MFKNLTLRKKVLIIVLFIVFSTAGIVGTIAVNLGRKIVLEESYKKLTAIRELKGNQIENHFKLISEQVKTSAESLTVIEAMLEFRKNFRKMVDGASFVLNDWESMDHLPDDRTGYLLAHQTYHFQFKNYTDRFEYYDFLLVEPDSGYVVYSVKKQSDFGISLLHGPFDQTNLAEVFQDVLKNNSPEAIRFADFEPYPPSSGAPASFIAAPIHHQGQRIGVLIFQLSINNINSIMTNQQQWEEMGLGNTGETYLVGPDFRMRNQSRFLVQDPDNYFSALRKSGLDPDTIDKIKQLNTTIGWQPIRTVGTKRALKGETGTALFPDYRGVEVLSAYRPLNVEEVDWVILSEIDKTEAFRPLALILQRFLIWFALMLVILLILSFVFARSIARPVLLLTKRAALLAEGNMDESIRLNRKDEVGELAESFELMRVSIKRLITDLNTVNEALEEKVRQRTIELKGAKDLAETLLDMSPVPVAVVDASTANYVRVNKAMTEFHKLEAEELLNRSTLETYFDPDNDRPKILEQLKQSGKVEGLEVRSRRIGTREDRWTIISVHPMQFLGEDVYITSLLDITDRKQLEAMIRKEKERMEGELNVAKEIQMSMLPLIFPPFPKRKEIDLFAKLIPAREVGGDFYDFYFLDENRFCFVVGDVSGKGVPAALMMAVTKTLLKSQAANDRSPASILTHVNNEIARDNDACMFITVFMAILDTTSGELIYSNAGHNPSYILPAKRKGHVRLADLHGPVIGAMEGMTYTETRLNIHPNDLIVAYTDGVTEAQNNKEELYSEKRFQQLLEQESGRSPEQLTKKIISSVQSFENGAEQFDDITLLVVQFKKELHTIKSHQVTVEIENKLTEIARAIESFSAFGEKNSLPETVIQKCNIVLDELLNNSISYGFQDDKKHRIKLNCQLKEERLIITIEDDGVPFNPLSKKPPDTSLPVGEREIGGLGIHLVKNLMDSFNYERIRDKNIITLVINRINDNNNGTRDQNE